MYSYGERHPVILEVILTVAAFGVALGLTIAANMFLFDSEWNSSLARIVTGLLFMLIYLRAFRGPKPKNNLLIALPALLFAGWNVYYNLSSGLRFGGLDVFTSALVTALAPAVFEEVLFRGIFIYNLDKADYSGLGCMVISALFFAALHLTNAIGMDLVSVGVQVGYSFVIGLVLGAIYVWNKRITQVILLHFLIDFCSRIYDGEAGTASNQQLIVFGVLMLIEAVYAVVLMLIERKRNN